MIEVYDPSMLEKYFTTDGKLTVDGMKLFTQLIAAIKESQVTIEDHEARIGALEP